MPRTDTTVINLVGKNLPRNDAGDVEFATPDDVYEYFTPAEVKVLVERSIYHMEYQRAHHKKYSQRIRDIEKPVKEAAKRMFPGIAWINLTEDQVSKAMQAVMENRKQ